MYRRETVSVEWEGNEEIKCWIDKESCKVTIVVGDGANADFYWIQPFRDGTIVVKLGEQLDRMGSNVRWLNWGTEQEFTNDLIINSINEFQALSRDRLDSLSIDTIVF